MEYLEFLKSKQKKVVESGFNVDESSINQKAFEFQKYLIKRGLKLGRYGNYSLTGLGKTIMLLEWSNQIVKKTNKPVLVIANLGVTYQIIVEGDKFGYKIEKFDFETGIIKAGIYITNYEQIKNLTDSQAVQFSGCALDEASILKNYTGKLRNLLTKKFAETRFKSCFSATPAPNEVGEIGQQSEFLGVLDSTDMRAKWFVRDEGMNNYRLKHHAKGDFYNWIKSWADMINSPADLGFELEGKKYELPPLELIERNVDVQEQDNGKLFNDAAVSATEKSGELRRTLVERCEEAIKIIKETPNESILVWVELNSEADYIRKRLNEVGESFREVRGSDKPENKEIDLIEFAKNKYRVLVTKKSIAGFGMNYQNCGVQIHVSPDFSFELYYQALRRSHRFGRKDPVKIYLINIPTMENARLTIERKQRQFDDMRNEMVKSINSKYGLVMDYEKQEVKTDQYHIIKGDSTIEIDNFPDESFDFSIFSPPFSMLFTYSNSYRDMGNCESHEQFFKQNQFLLDKLFRKMKIGSLVAVHSKDLAVYKGSSGYTGLYDFTGDYHRAMEKAGFKYHSKVTIWTDPVLEMQRTKTQRLLYKQLRADSKFTGVGLPEYLTIFKKWDGLEDYRQTEDYKPVTNKNFNNFPLDTWQRWASPIWGEKIGKEDLIEMVKFYYEQNGIDPMDETKWNLSPEHLAGSWFDIKRTDVLNNREGTDMGDEKHIAPLQLTVIQRSIQMWTNIGDVVFTPFLGIGSEVYSAVKLDRFGCGVELKDSYFETAKKNIRNVCQNKQQKTLF